MGADLEALKHIFSDKREHVLIGQITKLALNADRSALMCMVQLLTDSCEEAREIVAMMTWEAVGPEAGFFVFPAVGDLVTVKFAEGDAEHAFIDKRLTSTADKIPSNAVAGHAVLKSLAGKMIWLTSDTKINLSAGDTAPTENLVLGQQLISLLVDILTQLSSLSLKVSTHTHPGNLGYPTGAPYTAADFVTIKTALDNLKASPVQDAAILSDIAFTEKG